MNRRLHYLLVLIFLGVANVALAQNGAIVGKVFDDRGEPAIGAIVQVTQGGIVKSGAAVQEEDGSYSIKALSAGRYNVKASFIGYKDAIVTDVVVSPDKNTGVNITLEQSSSTTLNEAVVIAYKVPLIDRYQPGTTTTLTSEQIEKLPTRSTNDAVSLAGTTYQQKNGANVSIGGARANGTLYIIDGVQVRGISGTNFPPGSIDQIQVITSGIPARYGDATGGVINITTKGPSSKLNGSLNYEHSIDGYNHNQAFFTLSGPLLKKKIDSLNKRPILGFSLSGSFIYDADNDPTYFENPVVKDNVLADLRAHPLTPVISSNGVQTNRYSTEFVTNADLTTQKQRQNADYTNYRGNTRIDYQVADNMTLALGGNYSYIKAKSYRRGLSLFAPEAIPTNNFITGRGYIRFTQRFGKNGLNRAPVAEEETPKVPVISNAFYSVQADYQLDYSNVQDPNHKQNPFRYGYIGKFDQNNTSFFLPITDDSTGKTLITLLTRNRQESYTFQRSEINPLLANYTSEYYRLLGDRLPSNSSAVRQGNGLLNGDQPNSTFGLWSNVGTAFTGYSYQNAEQFAFDVNASFDLQPKKTVHSIEFGLYYQQRAERTYSNSGARLWNAMRLLTNRHLTDLDLTNPIYIKNGDTLTLSQVRNNPGAIGPYDTLIYNQAVDTTLQSVFDRNLRIKLGLNPYGTNLLNPDALDPSFFSMSMFSADEILNSGDPIATYYGYDYTGKRLNGQINFNDWFTKRDANGNYTREVGAFRPNYIAGYILDKFQIKDALFNLGVRVERFDANTKVLKDPYSLYATQTVANSSAVNDFNGGVTPSNIGKDYVVYVDNNASTRPQVIGYRNGDDWYDPYGKIVQDPSSLKNFSGGRDPQPHLQVTDPANNRAYTIRDTLYDPNTSFTDYTPQVNVMPRLSFTFPIAEKAMFYAHYDVLVQRPKSVGEIFATPADYYYLNQNAQSIVANPNLKPEKVFDYELGFQQQVSNSSAITINAFYKERKDQIQVRPYLYAYPTTYYTFGNRDFSTTKGVTLKYDLRRTNHLSLNFNYTLNFVEGSGSSSTSSAGSGGSITSGLLGNIIAEQLPNLRFAFPLSNDSRHIINLNADYRFDDGEGPVIGNAHILENAGINIIARARSGEPYTRYAVVNSQTVQGGVASSRLPWHYMVDMRVDKNFNLGFGKKNDAGFRKTNLSLQAFVYITNLLNRRDILFVDGFTNSPSTDGYLASPQGQTFINSIRPQNQQSYVDLYTISSTNSSPSNYNNPRQINIGIGLNF